MAAQDHYEKRVSGAFEPMYAYRYLLSVRFGLNKRYKKIGWGSNITSRTRNVRGGYRRCLGVILSHGVHILLQSSPLKTLSGMSTSIRKPANCRQD
jgi:hypothetical protein